MSEPIIETPRGFIHQWPGGKAVLIWNTRFKRWQKQYSQAQRFVDSEVLRLSEPYIPLLTGMLIKSGILGTEIGSGLVQWIAPYARPQYYSSRAVGSETGARRGPFWFQRMKELSGRRILAGARRIAGGGSS
jgi:hypothetical protein